MTPPATIRLQFVTPERSLVHEDVDEVQLPGEDGSFGVLPGHAPLLAALKTGEMWFRKGTTKQYAFIAGGFAEVLPDSVSVLARTAERAEDIDAERAEAALRRAQERIASPAVITDFDVERARIALERAVVRLHVSQQSRHRG